MGEHFVLLMDGLLTESTLEATIERANRSRLAQQETDASVEKMTVVAPLRRSCSGGLAGGKMVECRICHDEDDECNMEIPCYCCGSLKYAHRKCIQRWCNEKGDTMCEICLQQYKPGYTAPPQLFHYGGVPMTFRGNWAVSRRDIDNHRLIAMVASDSDYSDTTNDDYTASTARSVWYCRLVTAIFLFLLILRHILPIIIDGYGQFSLSLFTLIALRISGILLPVYVLAWALSSFYRSRRQQGTRELPVSDSDDEQMHFPSQLQTNSHLVHIQ